MGDDSIAVQVQKGLADQLHLLPQGQVLDDELHEVKSYYLGNKDGEK